MRTSLAVVIVNYRTAGLVVDCLRSLAPQVAEIPGTQVVVVDNASGDGSADEIGRVLSEEGFSGSSSLLALDHNGGFSAGNNAALRRLLKERQPPGFFLLLNPDTIVRRGALAALLDAALALPRAGIVGSSLEGPDGTPQPSTFRFPSVLGEFESAIRLGLVTRLLSRSVVVLPRPASRSKVDWVCGASMLVRREIFDEVGLLDEGFFLFCEETDLCLRAARHGWETWFEPGSRVVHLAGQSTGFDPAAPGRRVPAYVLESRRRYFVKNHGAAYASLADLAWVTGHLAWRARMTLERRPTEVEPGFLRDFLRQSIVLRRGRP
jgi:N-acetylglucosaminyl-diphospho-decaprenol L-rhamnosyltransferase